MNQKANKKFVPGLAIIAVLIVLIIVLNMIFVQMGDTISLALAKTAEGGGSYTEEELKDKGYEVNVQQEEEGAVLLKNDGALPLDNKKVTILGYASVGYSMGNGSGASAGKTATDLPMVDAFNNAGINVNSDAWSKLQTATRKASHISGQTSANKDVELAVSSYESSIAGSIGSYTDAAVITFARLGGEGATIEIKDLQLTPNEKALLEWADGKFDKVIVLLNTASIMEAGEIAKYADAILWIGTTGAYGMQGVANLLKGTVSPSGRTVDTWAYDMTTAPALLNINDNKYANFTTNGYYQYEEGIYVGYRWYETAYAEGYWDGVENEYGEGYKGIVQYPFGYGLTYAEFSQTIKSSDINLTAGGSNSITVTVKNDSTSVKGKEVVQIYLRAPYNQDETCGINDGTRVPLEKADKVLVGFAKTSELAPGASEDVTVTFETDDLASYDVFGHNCYVLEKGEYEFVVGANAHDEIASVKETLDSTIIYKDGEGDQYVGARASDEVVATNQLNDVTTGDGAYSATLATAYLSRQDFATGIAKIKNDTNNNVSAEVLAVLSVGAKADTTYTYDVYVDGKLTTETNTYYYGGARQEAYAEKNYYGVDMDDEQYAITYGVDKMTSAELTLKDMENASFDDERWDIILDTLSIEDMILWQRAQDTSPALTSIGKEAAAYIDGAMMVGADKGITSSTWFACAGITAATWNVELVEKLGEVYGNQAVFKSYLGVYAPSMNIHRTPLGGRNIEYYSEDGFISGKIGAAQVKGIQSTGTEVFLKHCILNDNDTNRSGAITWVSEQAFREIYAMPYELSVKQGGALGIMGSLNRVGMTWGHPGFYLSMLRDEWGYKGLVITDMATSGAACMTSNVALLSGIAMLKGSAVTSYGDTEGVSSVSDLSNYSLYMLREVAHYGLYQYVNSNAFATAALVPNTTWHIGWIILDIVLVAGIVLVYIFMVHKGLVAKIKGAKSAPAEGADTEAPVEKTNDSVETENSEDAEKKE